MNVEFEVKNVLGSGMPLDVQVERITELTTFKEEDILNAIKKGGSATSEVYGTLINLDKKNHDN